MPCIGPRLFRELALVLGMPAIFRASFQKGMTYGYAQITYTNKVYLKSVLWQRRRGFQVLSPPGANVQLDGVMSISLVQSSWPRSLQIWINVWRLKGYVWLVLVLRNLIRYMYMILGAPITFEMALGEIVRADD